MKNRCDETKFQLWLLQSHGFDSKKLHLLWWKKNKLVWFNCSRSWWNQECVQAKCTMWWWINEIICMGPICLDCQICTTSLFHCPPIPLCWQSWKPWQALQAAQIYCQCLWHFPNWCSTWLSFIHSMECGEFLLNHQEWCHLELH